MLKRALLMSAGMGTRLRPLTDAMPKPLVPLAGRPMIAYALDLLEKAGVREVMVNVHHFADLLEAYIVEERKRRPGLRLEIQDERAELLGSGGAVKRAAPWLFGLEERALIFNADSLIRPDIAALVATHEKLRPGGTLITLSLMEHADAGRRYNAFALEGARVSQHVKADPERQGSFFHFPGLQVMEHAVIERVMNEPANFCMVEKLWKPVMAEGRLGAWRYEGPYLDLGTPGDIAAAEAALARKEIVL